MTKTKKPNHIIRIKTIIITILGLSMMVLALSWSPDLSRFFELLSNSNSRGGYLNNAIIFFVGLVLFGFGLYEIGRSIYLQRQKKRPDTKDDVIN